MQYSQVPPSKHGGEEASAQFDTAGKPGPASPSSSFKRNSVERQQGQGWADSGNLVVPGPSTHPVAQTQGNPVKPPPPSTPAPPLPPGAFNPINQSKTQAWPGALQTGPQLPPAPPGYPPPVPSTSAPALPILQQPAPPYIPAPPAQPPPTPPYQPPQPPPTAPAPQIPPISPTKTSTVARPEQDRVGISDGDEVRPGWVQPSRGAAQEGPECLDGVEWFKNVSRTGAEDYLRQFAEVCCTNLCPS